ncbi:MAG: proton-conducting transporter membrane subunit [Elusimicrobia bacterium]|nr:proton-conducting transporter membrane subunit [Elusimicrobiota bacterium]
MILLVVAVSFLGAGALLSLLLAGRPRASRTAFLVCSAAGCLTGLMPALFVLAGGELSPVRIPWAVPMGELFLAIDPLSAFFLLPIFVVGLAAGVYGEGYLEASHGHLPTTAVRFFYLLLTASMALVVCAHNAMLFLAAWEVMALAAFFLVCAEDRKPEVRRAGLIYIVCTHTAILCLFVLFAVMGARAGSMDFSAMKAAMPGPGPALTGLFALALVGFGLKIGFMPLHFWLPEAHPVAPSHASAVLSAVVLKMGVYGLLRFISFCPAVPKSWGVVLLALGAASALLGVLFALSQRDLKRLLAYSSIENVGIILMGIGLGCLGLAHGRPVLAAAGFAAALLHVLNHSLFKSLLFLGAGAFYQALGTREIEGAGGLLRRMPWTSLFAWAAAASACGLPPFCGFIGEWLLYRGFIRGGLAGEARAVVFGAAALALIGGLAAACFTMAYGAVTLGEPRGPAARDAKDPGSLMLWPMGLLGAACLALGILPGPAVRAAARGAAAISGLAPAEAAGAIDGILAPLPLIGALGACVIGLAGLFWLARRALLRDRSVATGPTWGCGFSRPSPAMQYTGSSYAQPLVLVFSGLLMPEVSAHPPSGYWPASAGFISRTPDPVLDRTLSPVLSVVERALAVARRVQHGHLQYYLLHVLIFLILVLMWKL